MSVSEATALRTAFVKDAKLPHGDLLRKVRLVLLIIAGKNRSTGFCLSHSPGEEQLQCAHADFIPLWI